MDRSLVQRKSAYLTALALLLLSAFGCQGLMVTAAYLIRGNDEEPEYAGLKGKTVAVVCRSEGSVQYSYPYAAHELAAEVARLLKTNVPKIKVIDQQQVNTWIDKHDPEQDYVEIGKGVKADMLVAIELESFNLKAGQTLYQGRANTTVRVYCCRKDKKDKNPELQVGKEVFHKTLTESVWPKGTQVQTERTENDFRREYISVLGGRIGRMFYAHDRYAEIGQDTSAWHE